MGGFDGDHQTNSWTPRARIILGLHSCSNGLGEVGKQTRAKFLAHRPCGAVLRILTGADVGEYTVYTLKARTAIALAFQHDGFVRQADEPERCVEPVGLPAGVAVDLDERGRDAFADGDFQPVFRRQRCTPAVGLENELVAQLLADSARDRRDVDRLELLRNVGAANGRRCIKETDPDPSLQPPTRTALPMADRRPMANTAERTERARSEKARLVLPNDIHNPLRHHDHFLDRPAFQCP